MNLVQITAPHFVAGIDYGDGRATPRYAPIIGYMRGWSFDRIRIYCSRKGWMLEVL
jgi:hypothetical protein